MMSKDNSKQLVMQKTPLEIAEQKAKQQLEDIKVRYCDVDDIVEYIAMLKTANSTAHERICYLEGYSEALFVKAIGGEGFK